ncbi:MAG: SDR family oxidoreductase [Promethearchaeota archaeon]
MKNNTKIDDNRRKKILLIGANGFLGTNIIQAWKENQNLVRNLVIHASDVLDSNIPKDIQFTPIDITNKEQVIEKILKIEPEIVLLTAAMTDVDQNEINKELAKKINVIGPKNVLEACKKINGKLVFLSTDFIFDGKKPVGEAYTEEDIPNPISYYGKTKLEAENAILRADIPFLICRTAVLYGWNPQKLNFITWILNELQQGHDLSIVTSQINNPTHVRNLAEILLKLIQKDAMGIFHTAGARPLNRYEMALKCAEHFNYNKNLITPLDRINQIAKRPENAALDISKLKIFLNGELEIFDLDMGLQYMKTHPINDVIPS